MKNTVSYFEIPVSDFRRGLKFYNFIFGNNLTVKKFAGQRMAFFPSSANGVRGSIVESEGYKPCNKGVIPYLTYKEDINIILSKVTLAGGQVIVPPKTTLFGAEHKFAVFIDSEGNRIGIFRTYLE